MYDNIILSNIINTMQCVFKEINCTGKQIYQVIVHQKLIKILYVSCMSPRLERWWTVQLEAAMTTEPRYPTFCNVKTAAWIFSSFWMVLRYQFSVSQINVTLDFDDFSKHLNYIFNFYHDCIFPNSRLCPSYLYCTFYKYW